MIIDCGDRKSAGFVETLWFYGVQQEIETLYTAMDLFIQQFFCILKLQCVNFCTTSTSEWNCKNYDPDRFPIHFPPIPIFQSLFISMFSLQ